MWIKVVILSSVAWAYFAGLNALTHVAMNQAAGIVSVYTLAAQHPDQLISQH